MYCKKSQKYEAFDLETFFRKVEERDLKSKDKEENNHDKRSKRRDQ